MTVLKNRLKKSIRDCTYRRGTLASGEESRGGVHIDLR